MEAEDLIVNEGGQGQVVKQIGEIFPDVCIAVLAQAFVIEAIDLGDLSRLVIATKNGDAAGISDLESDKKSYGFDRIVASINVVACCGLMDGYS